MGIKEKYVRKIIKSCLHSTSNNLGEEAQPTKSGELVSASSVPDCETEFYFG